MSSHVPTNPRSWLTPSQTKGTRSRALLAILIASCIWSTEGIVVRNLDIPSVTIAAGRLIPLAILGAGLCLSRNNMIGVPPKGSRSKLLLLGSLIALNSWMYIAALKLTTIAIAAVLLFTWPIWLFWFYSMMGFHRPQRGAWLALGFSLLGMLLLVVRDESFVDGAYNPWGIAAALGASLLVAAIMAISKSLDSAISSPTIYFWQSAVALVALAPIGIWITPISLITFRNLALLAVLGLGISGLGGALFLTGLRRASATEVGVLSYAEPMMATLLAAVFLHETPRIQGVIGIAIVVIVGLWTVIFARPTQLNRQAKRS